MRPAEAEEEVVVVVVAVVVAVVGEDLAAREQAPEPAGAPAEEEAVTASNAAFREMI